MNPTSRRFDAVVFDYGGVIISPITRQIDKLAEYHEMDKVAMLEVLMGPRHESTPDHPWHRAERGEVAVADIQDLLQPVAEKAGVSLRGDEIDLLFERSYVYRQEVLDRIRALRADGYITAMLTNSVKEFQEVFQEDLEEGLFDHIIDSSEVGMRKPERRIYSLVTERLGVEAGRIVYLDDFDHNLGPAVAEGWTVVHVTDPAEALAELDRLLAG